MRDVELYALVALINGTGDEEKSAELWDRIADEMAERGYEFGWGDSEGEET